MTEKIELKCNHLGVRSPGQRKRVCYKNSGKDNPFKTVQADKDRACIHRIMERARKSGMLPQSSRVALPDTMPHVESFMDAMNIVVQSTQMFEALPSNIREKFANSPENFLNFVGNPDNSEELYSLGLAIKPAENAPIRVEMVNSPEQKPAEKPATQ